MRTQFIPPLLGVSLLLLLVLAPGRVHAQGQGFLTGFQLNVVDPAGGSTSAELYRWTPETRAVRIGNVTGGSARFTFEQLGLDLPEGTPVQVVQHHGVGAPRLYLVAEENARSLENIEMLGPQDALDRLATFDWGRVPVIDVRLEHAPAIPGMGFSDGGRDLFAEPQEQPVAPRRPYIGFTVARDRERSATSFGLYGEFNPTNIGNRVQVLTKAEVARQGLNYGSRAIAGATLILRLPVRERAGIRVGGGLFFDRVSVDFGSGSTSETGNGWSLGAALDADLTRRLNAAIGVDRQSSSGFSTPSLYAQFGLQL